MNEKNTNFSKRGITYFTRIIFPDKLLYHGKDKFKFCMKVKIYTKVSVVRKISWVGNGEFYDH